MDRRQILRTALTKTTSKIKQKAGKPIGDRHFEDNVENATRARSEMEVGKAMEAVREIVGKE